MNVFLISLIGAAIILDKYAFGEFGFSQPLISGTIIGAIFGNVTFGIFLGALLQLIFLGGLPIGSEIPPDGQAAGIIGCTSFFILAKVNSLEHALFLAIIFALSGGLIGGTMEIHARRFNEKLYYLFAKREEFLFPIHFAGLVTAYIRGLCLLLPIFIISSILIIPDAFPGLSKELLTIISVSIGLANGIYLFIKKTTMVYLIIGVVCGLVLLAL